MKNNECVKCGYCCTVRSCSYGKWSYEKNKCEFLTEDTLCGIYEKIKKDPMFGGGCSSSLFNTIREKKIAGMINVKR